MSKGKLNMSKTPVLKNAAKEKILSYLQSLYFKKANQVELSAEEDVSIRSITQLSKYLSSQEKYNIHVYEPGDTVTDYQKPTGEGFCIISYPSFRNAVEELISDGKIERTGGLIQYSPDKEEREAFFPILKMASSIDITPLPWQDLAFFQVRRGLSAEVANYINHQFYNNDIYAVSLGDIIMCIDMAVPSGSKIVVKRETVHERVTACLAPFHLNKLSDFHGKESKIGYTAAEVYEQRLLDTPSQQEEQEMLENMSGGIIKQPRKRRVKKK